MNANDMEALAGRAQRCREHAKRIDALTVGEYRLNVLDRRWLESNRLLSAARRYERKAAALRAQVTHG